MQTGYQTRYHTCQEILPKGFEDSGLGGKWADRSGCRPACLGTVLHMEDKAHWTTLSVIPFAAENSLWNAGGSELPSPAATQPCQS